MSLINHLEIEFAKLPDALRAAVSTSLMQWHEQLADANLAVNQTPEFTASLVKVWYSSLFVAESCLRNSQLLIDLDNSGDLSTPYSDQAYAYKLAGMQIDDEDDLMTKLRRFRRREMVRIAWRDLAGWAPVSETLMELSWLADACIQTALAFLYEHACEKRGTPLLPDGSPQQIIVLGMGKLGAFELNYSSDIDLIFAYPEDGGFAGQESHHLRRVFHQAVSIVGQSARCNHCRRFCVPHRHPLKAIRRQRRRHHDFLTVWKIIIKPRPGNGNAMR